MDYFLFNFSGVQFHYTMSRLFHFQSPFSTLRHSDAILILVKSISLIKYNSDKVVLKFKALKI